MYIVSHFCAVCSPSVVGNFLKCCIQYYLMCVFMQKIVDLLFMLYMFITFRLEILCSHSYPFYLLAKCFFRSDIQCMQVTASCGSSVGVVEYAHTISWPSVARSDKTSVAFVVCVCCVVLSCLYLPVLFFLYSCLCPGWPFIFESPQILFSFLKPFEIPRKWTWSWKVLEFQ